MKRLELNPPVGTRWAFPISRDTGENVRPADPALCTEFRFAIIMPAAQVMAARILVR